MNDIYNVSSALSTCCTCEWKLLSVGHVSAGGGRGSSATQRKWKRNEVAFDRSAPACRGHELHTKIYVFTRNCSAIQEGKESASI